MDGDLEPSPRAARWVDADHDEICDVCLSPLDDCKCACPFCGETNRCVCSIGVDVVTGG